MDPAIAWPLSEKISTFKKLATDAHSKERLISEAKRKEAVNRPQKKDKGAPSANTTEVKSQSGESGQAGGKSGGKRLFPRKEYTFLEQDVLPAFHWMMERGMLKLPDPPVP